LIGDFSSLVDRTIGAGDPRQNDENAGYLEWLSRRTHLLKESHHNTGAMRQLVDHEHWILL